MNNQPPRKEKRQKRKDKRMKKFKNLNKENNFSRELAMRMLANKIDKKLRVSKGQLRKNKRKGKLQPRDSNQISQPSDCD